MVIVLFLTLKGRTRNLVLGGIAASAILVGLTQMDKISGFQREQSASETRESADMRVSFAYVSWLMFQDRPVFGFGFGRFPIDKLPYLSDRSTELHLEDIRAYVHHNTYLSLLTDTGLIGLGLFLTMFGLMGREAWRTCRGESPPWAKRQAALFLGATGVYSLQLLFHELSYTPLDNSLVFFLAGCAGGVAPQRAIGSASRAARVGLPLRPARLAGPTGAT
jgi:O-antigen ligase